MRFLCTHTVPAGAIAPDQLKQLAQAAQMDPQVKGYRSFCNLSEGKAACIMDAPDRETLAAWFGKMGLPFDSISPLEYEGEAGVIRDVEVHAMA